MSLMEIARTARTTLDQRRNGSKGELVASYQAALARAVALAPTFRADREALELMTPCTDQPALPPAARHIAAGGIVAASAMISTLISHWSPTTVLLGAVFGVAVAFSGDRVGAGLRTTRRTILSDPAVLVGPCVAAVELAAVAVAAALAAGSAWPGFGLITLGAIAVVLGHATRVGDAAAEARENARRAARRRLEQSEQAIRAAVESLRTAHAADLARIATEMGRLPKANENEHDARG